MTCCDTSSRNTSNSNWGLARSRSMVLWLHMVHSFVRKHVPNDMPVLFPRQPSCKKKWGTDESGSFARNCSKSGSFCVFSFYTLLYFFRLLTLKCTLCMHNFDVSLQHMKNDNGDRTRPSKHQTLFMEATLVLRLTPNHCPSKLKTLSMQLTDTKQC